MRSTMNPIGSSRSSLRLRWLAALAALTVNGLLWGALTLTGRADAEPSSSATTAPQAAATTQEAIQPAPSSQAGPSPAAKRKPRPSVVRRTLPVHDFGGY
jgi:hypothetical protein